MRKILPLIVLSFFAVGAAFAQTKTPLTTKTQSPPPPAKKSAVKFNEVVYNFGQVAYNSDVQHTFQFQNVSSEPIAIKDVGTSCGCTTPSYSKEPVAPGKMGSVTAKYDSSRIGAFTKTLTVYINSETIRLMIKGTILTPQSDNSSKTK